ncbi:MAG: hypothetical protein U9Q82_06300 [Chloroflexota bacterium]|nr:hypothetical protein [Chloroflexota bacterium]
MTNVKPSQQFVIAKGFKQIENGFWALVGHDDSLRLFAELNANPDLPEVRPQEAYQALLASMQPGLTLRILQIFWPDPVPRTQFQKQVQDRSTAEKAEGLELLQQGLLLFVQEFPLPFMRRTIIEFVLPNNDAVSWWESVAGLFRTYGVRVTYLEADEIQSISRWIFNPNL